MALTDTAIRALKPGAKDYKAADEKGLHLLVTPTGGRLWRLKYRSPGGVERKLSLGAYPDVGLKDARDLRDDARKLLASGADPAERKRRDRHAEKVSAANSFGAVAQDARTVRTKFAKTFRTFFMPVCETALDIVTAWIGELEREHLWGPADPLFPATKVGLSEGGGFVAQGLARHGWATTSPIRDIFKHGFAVADLPYFNPHSFRDMLVRHAMQLSLPVMQMKAWSQNLGHSDLMTTFTSYGAVPVHKQGELIRELGKPAMALDPAMIAQVVAAMQKMAGDGTA